MSNYKNSDGITLSLAGITKTYTQHENHDFRILHVWHNLSTATKDLLDIYNETVENNINHFIQIVGIRFWSMNFGVYSIRTSNTNDDASGTLERTFTYGVGSTGTEMPLINEYHFPNGIQVNDKRYLSGTPSATSLSQCILYGFRTPE